MAKFRLETDGPDQGVFISVDGEVVQQTISSLVLSLSNEGRFLHVGQLAQTLAGQPYERQASHPVGKITLIVEYNEEALPWQ